METEGEHKPKVLIIEDDPGHQRLMELYCQRAGCVCECAFDGKTGLKKAFENPHDLIFIDIHIPEMDGFMVATQLREAGVRTPLIAVSALKLEGIERNAKAVGYCDFLQKPIDDEIVHNLLKTHLPQLAKEHA